MIKRLALAGLLALAAVPAQATCTLTNGYPFKDAAFNPQAFGALVLPDCRVVPYHSLVDGTGTPYSGSYGLPVSQQGAWTFGLSGPMPAGSNLIGHVLVDNLPATQPVSAAALPLPAGAATAAAQAALLTALGSPFQAGGSIANTAFGISGSLPAFAATPTFNLGTAPTLTVAGAVSVSNLPATQAVSAVALPLPAGAATAAAQPALNGDGGALAHITNLPATQAVSASALPLPAGAATSARQDTLDADLKATQPRSIASNAPSVAQSGSLSLIGDTVQLTVDGMNTVTLQLPSGAWSGTAAVDASADGGATWTQGLNVIAYSGGAATGPLTTGGLWEMAVGGLTTVRLRAVTTITGGPITGALRATNGLKSIRVGNPSGNPLTVTDPNNASYSNAGTAVASGALPLPSGVTVPRGVNAVCSTGGGAMTTFTLVGGGSVQKYIAPAPGSQDFGLAAITATAVTGCTFQAIY